MTFEEYLETLDIDANLSMSVYGVEDLKSAWDTAYLQAMEDADPEGSSKKEVSEDDYKLFQKLLKIWKHSSVKSGSYFICGEAGEHDLSGLPENILVCPSYGINVTAIYEKKHVGRSGQ